MVINVLFDDFDKALLQLWGLDRELSIPEDGKRREET